MSDTSMIEFGNATIELDPLPIPSTWVLEGAPQAKAKIIFVSNDQMSKTVVWECTAGRFNWFYDQDETLCVLEGGMTIKERSGRTRSISAGEIIMFRAGSSAEWNVNTYVRKVAFIRRALPAWVRHVVYLARTVRGYFSDETNGRSVF